MRRRRARREYVARRPGPRGRRARWLVPLLLSALLAAAASSTAVVRHLALRSASPAAGEMLDAVPAAIVLEFTEPVQLALSAVALRGPAGEVTLGPPEAPDGRQALVAPVVGPLVAGRYTVFWQAVGRDGHPVRGELAFEIAEGAAGLAAAAPEAVGPAEPAAPPAGFGTFDAQSPLYAGVRLVKYLGIVGTTGAACFGLLLVGGPRLRSRGASPEFL
jgi:copper resistance protein C